MSLQKGTVLSAVYVLFVYTITFLSDAVHLSTFGELSAQENHRKWMAMPSWIQMLREFQCECVDFECFGFDPLECLYSPLDSKSFQKLCRLFRNGMWQCRIHKFALSSGNPEWCPPGTTSFSMLERTPTSRILEVIKLAVEIN